jgi:tetratricopeptide (TPR) repeat protein
MGPEARPPDSSTPELYRLVFGVGLALFAAAFTAGLLQSFREGLGPPHGALAYARFANRVDSRGDHDRALKEFEGIFRVNREDRMAGLRRVELLERAGRDADALEALREVAERTGDPDARLRFAVTLWRAGRTDEARGYLEKIVAADPDAVLARLHLGDLLLSQGERQAALGVYRAALALDPTRSELGLRIRALEREGGRAAP